VIVVKLPKAKLMHKMAVLQITHLIMTTTIMMLLKNLKLRNSGFTSRSR
jgi:ABC-type enterochelin transport system permease subunit